MKKKFYGHSPASADSRRAVVSYWRKNVHLVLVNCLGGLPKYNVVRVTDSVQNDLKCIVKQISKPKEKNNNNKTLA